MARTLSVSRMQLSDDPADWVWFRWEWAKPGAKVMPWPHAFGHPIWHKGETTVSPGAQILLEGGVWRGNRTSRYDGQHIIGARGLWEEGLPAGARGPDDGGGCGGFGWLVNWGVGVAFHVPEDVVVPEGGFAIGGSAAWSLPLTVPAGGVGLGGSAVWSLPLTVPEGGVAVGGSAVWSLPLTVPAGGVGLGGETHSCLLANMEPLPDEIWVTTLALSGDDCPMWGGAEILMTYDAPNDRYEGFHTVGAVTMHLTLVQYPLSECLYQFRAACVFDAYSSFTFLPPDADWFNVVGVITFPGIPAGSCCDGEVQFTLGDAPTMPYQPLDADLTALAALTTVGYVIREGAADFVTATTVPWADISGQPTTLAGYAIADAYTISAADALLAAKAPLASPALTGIPTAPTAGSGTSTTQLATTAFVTTAVASAVTGVLTLRGSTNCSTNPNYPAALKGDTYIVTVAGRIGGASGKVVDVGDTYVAGADNAGGTEAAVGTLWFVLEHNLAGALLSANNLSDVANTTTALGNLGLTANAVSLVTAANYAAMRALLDLEPGTDFYSISAADALLAAKAPLASPALTGTPTAPTAAALTSTTQIATTAFVAAADAVLVGIELGNALKLTNETTTSTSFIALTTAQDVTFDAPASGSVSVEVWFEGKHTVAGGLVQIGLSLDGGTATLVGTTYCDAAGQNYPVSARWQFTGLSAGSHTISAQYRIAQAGTGTFFDRFMVVKRL